MSPHDSGLNRLQSLFRDMMSLFLTINVVVVLLTFQSIEYHMYFYSGLFLTFIMSLAIAVYIKNRWSVILNDYDGENTNIGFVLLDDLTDWQNQCVNVVFLATIPIALSIFFDLGFAKPVDYFVIGFLVELILAAKILYLTAYILKADNKD
jgi:hypothetical protein